MSSIARFGVSLDKTLLRAFDRWHRRTGFATRSHAIAELLREGLVTQEWKNMHGVVVGIVALSYDPGHHILSHTLTRNQHAAHKRVLSTQHLHLDERNCLEVIVLKGTAREVKRLADQLRSLKGIKHGQFVMTTTGKTLR